MISCYFSLIILVTLPYFVCISTIQGLMPIPDLILRFERSCRNGSDFRVDWVWVQHMASYCRGQIEAASWPLLRYLYRKVTEEFPGELMRGWMLLGAHLVLVLIYTFCCC